MTITPNTWWTPTDPHAARRYEQVHGGPMRLRVESVESDSPLAVVVLLIYTGPISTGRHRRTKAYRLVDEFSEEVAAHA